MAETLAELKKQIFYDLMALAGRVFISVAPDDDVLIGRRGFLPEEKEKGLVLVFNSRMKFTWDDSGITTTLVFGQTPEKCYIPESAIVSLFSPELNAQFSVLPSPETGRQQPAPEQKKPAGKGSRETKVIPLDFSRKR